MRRSARSKASCEVKGRRSIADSAWAGSRIIGLRRSNIAHLRRPWRAKPRVYRYHEMVICLGFHGNGVALSWCTREREGVVSEGEHSQGQPGRF
jgi:hypothetical protein